MGSEQNYRPSDLMSSKLRWYSYGILAANKELGSMEIEVTPTEELTMLDGELTTRSTQYTAEGVDSLGKTYKSSVEAQVSIRAEWLRFGDANRMTAPDVRRGESVMIYQFSDADKYYWMTLKQDASLRKLETVVWAFSGTKDETKKTDASSSYYLEISTHKGISHFHTSKANGEPFEYDIQINSKEGYVAITDDGGNFISMDSANARHQIMNSSGTHIDVDKVNLTMNVPGTYKVVAKNIELIGETLIDGETEVTGNMRVDKGMSTQLGTTSTGGFSTTSTIHSDGGISTSNNITASGTVHGSNI